MINTNLDSYNLKKGLKFDWFLKVDKDFGVDDIGDEVSKRSNDSNEIGKEESFTNVLIKSNL